MNKIILISHRWPSVGSEPPTLSELAASSHTGKDTHTQAYIQQPYRVQKPFAFVMRRHLLAVAAEALGPPVQDAVSVWGGVEGGGGSATAPQTTGHGVGRAVQQEHRAGFPHLTHGAGQGRSATSPEDSSAPSSFPLLYCKLLLRRPTSVCIISLHLSKSDISLPFVAFCAEQIVVILNTSAVLVVRPHFCTIVSTVFTPALTPWVISNYILHTDVSSAC